MVNKTLPKEPGKLTILNNFPDDPSKIAVKEDDAWLVTMYGPMSVYAVGCFIKSIRDEPNATPFEVVLKYSDPVEGEQL